MFLFQGLLFYNIGFLSLLIGMSILYIRIIKRKYELENETFKFTQENEIKQLQEILEQKSKKLTVLSLRLIELEDNFLRRLKEDFPQLTQRDIRLCALIKLNFSSKEIAQLSGISVESIHTSRYRLRKKFNLPRKNSLTDFIVNI